MTKKYLIDFKKKIEKHYDGRELLCFVDRPNDFLEIFKIIVDNHPNRTALVFKDKTVSYKKLDELSDSFAWGLLKSGLKEKNILVINLANSIEFVVALFASFKTGLIAMPVGHRHKKEELISLYSDAGVHAVIFDKETEKEQPFSKDENSILFITTQAETQTDCLKFNELLEKGIEKKITLKKIDEEDPAILLYTSGTTGRPKGAILTHLGLVHSFLHFQMELALKDGECTILAVPASHVTGLVAQILTLIGCAGKIVIMEHFEVQEFAILAKKHGLTYSILVPAMYALLLHRNALIAEDLQSWRIGAFGGAPMPDAVRKELASKLPFLSLHNAYGATETTSPTTIIPINCNDPGDSVGLVVTCGKIKIVDENNEEINQGETGELWIKGPMVVPGYWKNEKATENSFEDGYWKSGDIASQDENGFVRIHDRKKDMINRGGYKIFSAEIENLMMLMDQVQEAALVPYPCPILGERSHAFIFPSSASIEPNEIRLQLLEKVADYKVPDKITITKEPLPRNVNGKITKAPLREKAHKEL